jgi:hypothetical protein
MVILTIFGVILVALVTYAIFIMPYRTDWNRDMYEKPQSFTDVGLEAEWGIPRDATEEVPELTYEEGPNGNWSISRRLATAVETPQPLPAAEPQQQGRQRTITSIGWLAPDNTVVPGVRPVNRTELAEMIHEKMCKKGCTGVERYQTTLTCQCGTVSRYANASDGLVSGISV